MDFNEIYSGVNKIQGTDAILVMFWILEGPLVMQRSKPLSFDHCYYVM